MAAAPTSIVCIEYHRLKDVYRWAVSEYLRMQSAQLESVMQGDGFNFEVQIKAARRVKDEAKYAILTHLEQHCCGSA